MTISFDMLENSCGETLAVKVRPAEMSGVTEDKARFAEYMCRFMTERAESLLATYNHVINFEQAIKRRDAK